MAAEDYFPIDDYIWFTRTARTISCKHCKKKPMFWRMDSNGWYLVDTKGRRHNCRRNAEDELEVLE